MIDTRRTVRRKEEPAEEEHGPTRRCPECDDRLVSDERQGETRCVSCGLVVEEDEIDHGPEWRAYDASESESKSRVGAPRTNMLHDRGLSTAIGWRNEDASGSSLSPRQREKMQRLRAWNERFRTRDADDRNLKHALGEINRMASALGLPENTRQTASVIYRRALSENLLPGRSIEGVCTASLYAAARKENVPRSVDELTHVSRISSLRFQRAYRYLVKQLELQIRPADPEQYLPRFASELDATDYTERLARELLEDAKKAAIHSGKNPVGLAAAALYAGSRLADEDVTQRDVSDVTDVSKVTIRNRYQELLDAREGSRTLR